jgi:hypothetical protein
MTGGPLWALSGLWPTESERLLSPKETLKHASWGAETGTERTFATNLNRGKSLLFRRGGLLPRPPKSHAPNKGRRHEYHREGEKYHRPPFNTKIANDYEHHDS